MASDLLVVNELVWLDSGHLCLAHAFQVRVDRRKRQSVVEFDSCHLFQAHAFQVIEWTVCKGRIWWNLVSGSCDGAWLAAGLVLPAGIWVYPGDWSGGTFQLSEAQVGGWNPRRMHSMSE